MTPDIKELVKRLQRIQVGMANEEEDAVLAAIAALEALAGEVERLTSDVDALGDNLEKVVAERDRFLAGGLEADNRTFRATRRAEAAEAERDRLKAVLDIAKDHAKQNQRARDLVSPYPSDHAKRIVWEKALYHEGKDLWNKLRKALGDAS